MKQDRFAYLVMVHACDPVFRILMRMLDFDLNDIYVHVDGKVPIAPFEEFLGREMAHARVCLLPRRIKVYWAHCSQVEAELALFEAAAGSHRYGYYHLISGADLPIKSQEYIHSFFAARQGLNFIGFMPEGMADEGMILHRHVFPRHYRNSGRLGRLMAGARGMLERLAACLPAKSYDLEFRKGGNWVSITHECVLEILRHRDFFLREFRYSRSLDEWYKQTVVYNSPLRDTVYCYDDANKGCMRLIDWNRGSPYSWTIDDLPEVLASDKLFCRKIADVRLALQIYRNFADRPTNRPTNQPTNQPTYPRDPDGRTPGHDAPSAERGQRTGLRRTPLPMEGRPSPGGSPEASPEDRGPAR